MFLRCCIETEKKVDAHPAEGIHLSLYFCFLFLKADLMRVYAAWHHGKYLPAATGL